MTEQDQPCTYCGYTVSKYGRHGSSCPTYEIADLEKRLTEFEQRTLELEGRNEKFEALLRILVIYEKQNAGFLPVITALATRARKLLGMDSSGFTGGSRACLR